MIGASIWVRLHLEGSDGRCATITRERGEAWLAEYIQAGWQRERWSLVEVPHCRVCGAPATVQGRGLRCERHLDRNPCAIDGCKRSAAAPETGRLADDQWLCGEHWRRFVPPRSRMRRTYHAHFRRAKRGGWTDDSAAKFWRFWSTLVAVARRRSTEGRIDEKAIAELFGWEVDA